MHVDVDVGVERDREREREIDRARERETERERERCTPKPKHQPCDRPLWSFPLGGSRIEPRVCVILTRGFMRAGVLEHE